jgi:hypothetical protein
MTYTGSGLAYNGVPLVETAPSGTLVLTSDPSCATADGTTMTFPLATLCEQLRGMHGGWPQWPASALSCGCQCSSRGYQVCMW